MGDLAAAHAAGLSDRRETAEQSPLLDSLRKLYGEEGDAYYQALQDLDLIDENGRFVRKDIVYNGQAYSLEEIEAMIEAGAVGESDTFYVDGMPVPYTALKQMIDIERWLSDLEERIRFDPDKLTPEHLDSLSSLLEQATTEGLYFMCECSGRRWGPGRGIRRIGRAFRRRNGRWRARPASGFRQPDIGRGIGLQCHPCRRDPRHPPVGRFFEIRCFSPLDTLRSKRSAPEQSLQGRNRRLSDHDEF